MNVNEFKKIFRQLRKENGMTQDETSKSLGVSKSSIAMWETGQRLPSPDLYEQIADFFNVDIDYLYGRTSIRQQFRYDEDGNLQRTLSSAESDLLDNFQKLNAKGQEKAIEYVADLADNDKYTKNDAGGSTIQTA